MIAEQLARTLRARTAYRTARAPPGRRPCRLTCRRRASSRSAAGTASPSRCGPSAATRASITAVVSVADDGGSSGRLRRDLGVPAPGDLRKCLVALAGDDGPWPARVRAPLRDRRARGPRARQPGARRPRRDARRPRRRARRGRPPARRGRPGAAGHGRPGRRSRPTSAASRSSGPGRGRVDGRARDRIRGSSCVPGRRARQPRRARRRSPAPTRSCSRPGSLYTSVLAGAVRARDPADAVAGAPGRVVQVANLRTETPRPPGSTAPTTCAVLLEHGVRVDTFLHDPAARRSPVEPRLRSRELGVEPVGGRHRRGRRARRTIRRNWRLRSAALL